MYQSRKNNSVMLRALVKAHNDACREQARVGGVPHSDRIGVTSGYWTDPTFSATVVDAPTAADLPTALALLNNAKAVFNSHCVSALCHKAAVAAPITSPAATDLATAITMANEIKADAVAHAADTDAHYAEDEAMSIDAPNAADLPSLLTLANEIKSGINTHMDQTVKSGMIELVPG